MKAYHVSRLREAVAGACTEAYTVTRNRSGKNVRKAIAHGKSSVISTIHEPPAIVSIPSQNGLTLAAISGRLGHMLIATCTGSHASEDKPPFCAPIFDKWAVSMRYEAA